MRLLGSIRDDRERWRERGRKGASLGQMSDPVAREMTLRIATDHERLAEHTQRRRAFRPKPIAHRRDPTGWMRSSTTAIG